VKTTQDSLNLGGVHIQAGLSPDQVIGPGDLLFDGPLRPVTLLDLFGRPAAGQQALPLTGRRAGDTDRGVQLGLGLGLEQERNHYDSERMSFRAPSLDLGAPERPDPGMQYGLELPAGGGVGEHDPRQFVSAQAAIRADYFGAEGGHYLGQRRLARFDDLAGQVIGIHHAESTVAEQQGSGGLTHARAAGKAENPRHWRMVR